VTFAKAQSLTPPGRKISSPDAAEWQPMMIAGQRHPGFWIIPIVDDESGAWTSYWMRLDAGARSLMHTHTSTELLLIMEYHRPASRDLPSWHVTLVSLA
jgi:hypothetical protein